MWRGFMRKVADPFLLRMARRMETLLKAEKSRDAELRATLCGTVKIYPNAEIRNFLGDPRAIRIGAHSHIKGQLLYSKAFISVGEQLSRRVP